MGFQKSLAQIGWAKQTVKGTEIANPSYVIGLSGGNVYEATLEQNELQTTWNTRGMQGLDRISVVPGAGFDFIPMPNSLGGILMAALGSDVVTGAGPYNHAFTPAATLPWYTLHSVYAGTKVAVDDCKLDSLELSWEKSGAMKGKTKWVGRTINFGSNWTGGTTEQASAGTFKGAGGTFLVNSASARVVSGSIKIENNAKPIVAAYSITPDDVFEENIGIKFQLKIIPDDLTLFRYVVTGSTSGTQVSGQPVYGSIQYTMNGPVVASTQTQLTIQANNVGFETKIPDVDPKGGAAELTLDGTAFLAAGGGAPVIVTLTNNVATAY